RELWGDNPGYSRHYGRHDRAKGERPGRGVGSRPAAEPEHGTRADLRRRDVAPGAQPASPPRRAGAGAARDREAVPRARGARGCRRGGRPGRKTVPPGRRRSGGPSPRQPAPAPPPGPGPKPSPASPRWWRGTSPTLTTPWRAAPAPPAGSRRLAASPATTRA